MSATRPYLVPVRNPENGGVMEGRYVAKSEGAARAMAEADGFQVMGIISEEVAESSEKQGENERVSDEDLMTFVAQRLRAALDSEREDDRIVYPGRGWGSTIAIGVVAGMILSALVVPFIVVGIILFLMGMGGT